MSEKKYQTFKEFYPFYLSQHTNKTCRLLHVIGSSVIVLLIIYVFATKRHSLLLLVPVIGYGFAWVGHFVFEKNIPATFTYPVYSLMGDWVMWWQVLTGKIKL
ncbi:MAG: DUF962 domain-containing protein [Proteobacteria bacterium]|nr:DUF962 domain-containing protein [Pseudomonadota bacterium]